jgi:hypothetical protein
MVLLVKLLEFWSNFTKRIRQNVFVSSEDTNTSKQLIQAMVAIQSLFTTQTQISLNKENEDHFSFLADKFNNYV